MRMEEKFTGRQGSELDFYTSRGDYAVEKWRGEDLLVHAGDIDNWQRK